MKYIILVILAISAISWVIIESDKQTKFEYRLEIINDSTALINGYDNNFDTIPFSNIQEYIIKDNQ